MKEELALAGKAEARGSVGVANHPGVLIIPGCGNFSTKTETVLHK